jgi:hypothetical protein
MANNYVGKIPAVTQSFLKHLAVLWGVY